MWATRYGCCGPDKESSCYVDVGAAVCKDGSSCTLYRCRRYSLAGASFLFPFSFLHYFSLSLVYLFDLFDLIMHYRHLASSSHTYHTHTTTSTFFLSEIMSHFSPFSPFSPPPPLSLSSDIGSHTFSGGKFTCDSWWTHATNGKGPTCTDEKSPGFSHMTMKQVTNTMVSNGCCGPNGESFCEDQDGVDNGGTTNGSAGGHL